jgi:hypothetical protein
LINVLRKKNQEGFISNFQKKLGTAKNLLGLINVLRKKTKKVLFQAFKKLEPVKNLLGLTSFILLFGLNRRLFGLQP